MVIKAIMGKKTLADLSRNEQVEVQRVELAVRGCLPSDPPGYITPGNVIPLFMRLPRFFCFRSAMGVGAERR